MLNSGRVFTGNPLTPSPAAANSTMSLPFLKELIVDLFAGGGGGRVKASAVHTVSLTLR